MSRIGLTGATGFIGRRIIALAAARGHEVVAFSRSPENAVAGCVETRAFTLDGALDFRGLEAVIHLAGENVFGIWTENKKRRIRESRVLGTRSVADAFRRAAQPPAVLVSSSAVGYYGDSGEGLVDENSSAGCGFLPKVAGDWEREAQAAASGSTRVVVIRTGIVLGAGGGALATMAPVFRLGGGGELGDGQQWMSWIHLDDIARLFLHAVETPGVEGPLNGVAPQPVRNTQFTDTLALALQKPALFRVPAWLIRTALGGFSAELLDSKRVEPVRTVETGFDFAFPDLYLALLQALGEPVAP